MEGLQTESDILVLGTTSAAATEASLVSQEWITLPDGMSAAMPLSWGPFLVSHLRIHPPPEAFPGFLSRNEALTISGAPTGRLNSCGAAISGSVTRFGGR